MTEEQVDGKTLLKLNDDDLIQMLGLTPLKVNIPDEGEAFESSFLSALISRTIVVSLI